MQCTTMEPSMRLPEPGGARRQQPGAEHQRCRPDRRLIRQCRRYLRAVSFQQQHPVGSHNSRRCDRQRDQRCRSGHRHTRQAVASARGSCLFHGSRRRHLYAIAIDPTPQSVQRTGHQRQRSDSRLERSSVTVGSQTPHAFDFFSHTDFGPGSDNAVDNNGDSAGYIVTNSVTSATTAFMALSGSRVLLGTLGGTSSKAYGINDSDTVVGSSDVAGGGATHAFIYSNDNMVDLNSLVDPSLDVTLTNAFAINASGQIVGTLRDANGVAHGYLLTPVSTSNQAALMPTIMRNTLPTTITGKSVHGVVTLSITNSTATVEQGNAQIALYLASGASVDSSSISIGRISRRINLKPRAAMTFVLSITKLTESIPSGNYRLVAQATDSLGKTATAVAPTLNQHLKSACRAGRDDQCGKTCDRRARRCRVGNDSAHKHREYQRGRHRGSGFRLHAGWIDRSGEHREDNAPLHIGAGKSRKLVLGFVVPKTLTPGTYTPIVTITESGSTTTAVSPKPWTVS